MKSRGLIKRQTEEQESHVVLWGKNGSLLDRSGLIGWLGRNVFVRWSYTSVLKTWLSQLSVFPRAERQPFTDTSLTWWRSRQKSSFLKTLLNESQKLWFFFLTPAFCLRDVACRCADYYQLQQCSTRQTLQQTPLVRPWQSHDHNSSVGPSPEDVLPKMYETSTFPDMYLCTDQVRCVLTKVCTWMSVCKS